jgi:electron transfer flavoprotein alpha subunit
VNGERRVKNQVWVWAEHYQGKLAAVSLGLLGKARELCEQGGGGEVASILVGGSQQLASQLIDCGADKVYMAGSPSFSPFDMELCTHFIVNLIKAHQPDIVLWGATSLGREIASRVAAKLGTGLTAHCIKLSMQEIQGRYLLIAEVAGWGGNMTLKIICPERRPQMATVKPGIFSPPEPKKRRGGVVLVQMEEKASCLEIVEVVEEREEIAALEQAEVVAVGGWGMSSGGGFKGVHELAQILGGNVGGTRPALDAGWISAEQMIGQSGKTVAPRLLITLGVSGAAQFATAVLNSKLILAVDKNPKAPIFEMADIGIVGDLQEVLPLLINKLRAVKTRA